MKIQLWSIGNTHELYIKPGIELFSKRISHYFPLEWKLIAPRKNAASLSLDERRKSEGELILKLIHSSDVLVALDARGKQITAEDLASFIQQKTNESPRNIIFLIGGAYGLDESVIKRANVIWSLSTLVFPHQLVRLMLTEQIYRACTIMKNEKYHHS
ncbi:MAG: 23S rRNA (pseudouridine(1915)-N(3))-methyltransferase RlmH [Chitinophagaceae bacterium]|nr:23S rRNA (pseudouridine(1915)-N(3))-methyltransferase RlmH [Chitinophagaceae bacterium]